MAEILLLEDDEMLSRGIEDVYKRQIRGFSIILLPSISLRAGSRNIPAPASLSTSPVRSYRSLSLIHI